MGFSYRYVSKSILPYRLKLCRNGNMSFCVIRYAMDSRRVRRIFIRSYRWRIQNPDLHNAGHEDVFLGRTVTMQGSYCAYWALYSGSHARNRNVGSAYGRQKKNATCMGAKKPAHHYGSRCLNSFHRHVWR